LQAEVDAYIVQFAGECDERCRRLAVRNGSHQPRKVLTNAGPTEVEAPPVSDKCIEPQTTPSSSPSPPPVTGPRSPKAPAQEQPAWPWRSNSSSHPKPAGARSGHRTWESWSSAPSRTPRV
jgi:hypothetical protein